MSIPARQVSAEPAAESDSKSNETLQQSMQPIKSRDGKEPREWITEAEWTICIQENSDDYRRPPSVVSIFRVPNILKKSKREAYVPYLVSLGPYHHKSEELPLMCKHKGRALRIMRTRFNNNNRSRANDPNNIDFSNHARDEIMKLEDKIRDSYEEEIDCDGKTLARMLTLDGCFIIEILETLSWDELSLTREKKCYDPIFGKKKIDYARSDTVNDIVMLENQIPLIVLQELLKLEFNSDNIQRRLLKMSMFLLRVFQPYNFESRREYPQEQVHHLLGLLHYLLVSQLSDHAEHADEIDPIKRSNAWCNPIKCGLINLIKCFRANRAVEDCDRINRAIDLSNAGIKFKRCDGEIKFDKKNATLFLPSISVFDLTEILFRNLIAYEMCKPSTVNYFTCYMALMDKLIDSEDDVALLTRSGIVKNYLGSDAEFAQLINGLVKNVTVSARDVFQELKQDVHVHYTNEIKIQLALLVRERFSSPWKILALVGVILIGFLTILQTIYSILSYYK